MEEQMYQQLMKLERDVFALQEYCENLEDRIEVLEGDEEEDDIDEDDE